MDSANSGSIQSSSGGGDEEHSSGGAVSFLPTTRPSSSPTTHHPSLFDTFAYLESFPRSPPSTTNPFLLSDPSSLSPLIRPIPRTMTTTTTPISPAATPPPDPPPPRPSRKRSRASRRAPTTVLTTDTSNFRAMVQEFTGIPAAPFAPSRSRLDLFSHSSPPFLLRPFPQKPPSDFGLFSSSSPSPSPSNAATTTSLNAISTSIAIASSSSNTATTSTSTATNNYQLPHDLGPNMQSQMLTLQSLLQSPISTIPSFTAAKPHHPPPPAAPQAVDYRESFSGSLSSIIGGSGWSRGPENSESGRSSGCKINFSVASGVAVPEFPSQKSSDGAPGPRTEGMVDSWICSSE